MDTRYEAKVDWWIKALIYFTVAITVAPAFFMPKGEVLIYILITLPINIFMLWLLYGAYLEFRDEELYIKLGPIYGRVKYDNIKSISFVKSYLSSYAMTNKRVYIKVHNKTWIKGDIQVGPKDREEFVDELKRRCRNLEEN
jgi:hypothetical protein